MAKVRLGVALIIPPPLDAQIDVLRVALGDGALGRIMPHITLVPPVNVNTDELDTVRASLRAVAENISPIAVSLGPVQTFAPENPVIYLAAQPKDVLEDLRQQVFVPPLVKEEDHAFVPHVTICDDASSSKIEGAMASLTNATYAVTIDRIDLLQKDDGAPWRSIDQFVFGNPNRIGTGGLSIDVETSTVFTDEAQAFAGREWRPYINTQLGPNRIEHEPISIVARRESEVVGLLRMEIRSPAAFIRELLIGADTRGQGIAGHLLGAAEHAARQHECDRLEINVLLGCEAEGYLRHKGFVDNTAIVVNEFGRDLARIVKPL